MDEKTQTLLDILDEDGRQLHLLFARLTLSEDAAEDLMQELFLKLQRSGRFLRANNSRAYVRRAAIHLAFDWRRGQERRLKTEQLETDPAADTASLLDALIQREEVEQILAALDRVPKTSRDCVLLRYLQQAEYDKIGEQIGKTPHQVRALCHKAITRLRKLLHATALG